MIQTLLVTLFSVVRNANISLGVFQDATRWLKLVLHQLCTGVEDCLISASVHICDTN